MLVNCIEVALCVVTSKALLRLMERMKPVDTVWKSITSA